MLLFATMVRMPFRRALPWLGLATILIAHAYLIVRIHPENLFGYPQDDTFYFSSAQALARGNGYILPSVPGTPPSRFPLFFSWILSSVWKWNPSFPANLVNACEVEIGFGCAFTIATFVFLRRLSKLGNVESLVLTAFCALHPVVLSTASFLFSDIPFAAIALAALIVANGAMRRESGGTSAGLVGVLAGCSAIMRVVGVAIVAGIFMSAIFRKAWRQAIVFSAFATPFLVWLAWHTMLSKSAIPPVPLTSFGLGWRHTWLAYTNYVAFRKLSMVNPHVASTMFYSQAIYLLVKLPSYFISPIFDANAAIGLPSVLLVLWGVVDGLARHIKQSEWQPIHFAFLFFLAVTVSWSYPQIDRFLLLFLPLLALGLWLEGKQIARWVISVVGGSHPIGEKTVAVILGALTAVFVLGIVTNFMYAGRGDTEKLSKERGTLLLEKMEAYDWIRKNAPRDARVIAVEDVCVYLYADRQAMEPIEFSPARFYDPEVLRDDLDHLTDVAKAIGAEYWVASTDDTGRGGPGTRPQIEARLEQIDRVLPELFRSSGGHVKIYGTTCILHPENLFCTAADLVLFPTAGSSH